MATGANTTPLGRLHPVLAARAAGSESLPLGNGKKNPELEAQIEAAKRAASALFPQDQPSKKKRKSRWGSEESRTAVPGLPTVLPASMSETQQKSFLYHLRIEEISKMLRTGDLGIPLNPADRSPSPEPIYSHDGKRLNTREVRTRKKLEDERHELVQQAQAVNPQYKPPADYKPMNKKFEDKVFIPQDDHPETNFVGLLIGPRGKSLKDLERDTNSKIMIRGKGATKEGKFKGLPQPGEDEPLHALITANTPEAVKVAVDKIRSIIQLGIEQPGNNNELKQKQMMQLAELNGTFRPLDLLRCRNCGSAAHATWECSEQQNVTSSVICTRCGSGGHIASDCKADLTSEPQQPSAADKAKMDSEYLSLMKELGESVPDKPSSALAQSNGTLAGKGTGTSIPPPTGLVGKDNPQGVKPMDPTIPLQPVPWGPPPPGLMGPPPPMAMGMPPPGAFVPPPGMMMGPGRMAPPPWMPAPIPGAGPIIPMGMPPPTGPAPMPSAVPPPTNGLPPVSCNGVPPTTSSEYSTTPPLSQAGSTVPAPPPPPPPAFNQGAVPAPPPPAWQGGNSWAGAPPPPPVAPPPPPPDQIMLPPPPPPASSS